MANRKQNQYDDYDVVDLDEELTLSEEVSNIDKKNRNRWLKKFLTKIVLILLTCFLALSVFSVVSFCWADIDLQKDVTNKMTDIDGLFYTNTSVDADTLAKMQEFIANLPPSFKDAINDDWAIVLTNKAPDRLFHTSFMNINDYDTSGMIIGGYTFTQPRVVYVNVTMDPATVYDSFVHEIGHVLSFEHGSQHGTETWEQIYNSNQNFETDPYNLSNEAEFFAACYEEYQNSPEDLKAKSIDAYNFIASIVDKEVQDDNIIETFLTGCKNSINTLRVYYYYYIAKR